MGAELFGLLLGVTDFKARHAELFFGIWKAIGGEVVYELKGRTPRKNWVNVLFPVPRSVINRPSERSICFFHGLVMEPDSHLLG